MMPNTKPAGLFLCTHNAGRSQMAMDSSNSSRQKLLDQLGISPTRGATH
jgi:protein-tyrosine-phosphatase